MGRWVAHLVIFVAVTCAVLLTLAAASAPALVARGRPAAEPCMRWASYAERGEVSSALRMMRESAAVDARSRRIIEALRGATLSISNGSEETTADDRSVSVFGGAINMPTGETMTQHRAWACVVDDGTIAAIAIDGRAL